LSIINHYNFREDSCGHQIETIEDTWKDNADYSQVEVLATGSTSGGARMIRHQVLLRRDDLPEYPSNIDCLYLSWKDLDTTGNNKLPNLLVRLVHTELEDFEGEYGLLSQMEWWDIVYDRDFEESPDIDDSYEFLEREIKIDFDYPFEYDGTRNVIVDISWKNVEGSTDADWLQGKLWGIEKTFHEAPLNPILQISAQSWDWDTDTSPEEWEEWEEADVFFVIPGNTNTYFALRLTASRDWDEDWLYHSLNFTEWVCLQPVRPYLVSQIKGMVKGGKLLAETTVEEEFDMWLCTPKVHIPDSRFAVEIAMVGKFLNKFSDIENEFNLYISTTDQDPTLDGYSKLTVKGVEQNLTYSGMNHNGSTFKVAEDFRGCVTLSLEDYKGQDVYIAIRGKKEDTSIYCQITEIYEIIINHFDDMDRAKIHDFTVAYNTTTKRIIKDFLISYDVKTYSIQDLQVAYDILSTSQRRFSDLIVKYHLIDSSSFDGGIIVVDDSNKVDFKLITIKQPHTTYYHGTADITDISISANTGDFCYAISFTTRSSFFYEDIYKPYIDKDGIKKKTFIRLTVAGIEYDIIIESCSINYSFAQKVWTFEGRTLQCLLDAPYGFFFKYVHPKMPDSNKISIEGYMRSVWSHASLFVRYFADLIIGDIPYNEIPYSQLEVWRKSYIDILSELCEHFELMMIPHPNGDIEITRKYEWIGVREPLSLDNASNIKDSDVSPGFPEASHVLSNLHPLEILSVQENQAEGWNRIKIVGEKDKLEGNMTITVKDTTPSQELYPGSNITLEVFSSTSNKGRLWCNVGKFSIDPLVRNQPIELGIKFIVDEEARSIDNQTFSVQFPVINPPVLESPFGMTVYCIDNLRYYKIATYESSNNTFSIIGEFPHENSFLRISYWAKYFTDQAWLAPLFETNDCIIRGQTMFAETDIRLNITWAAVKMDIYLEDTSIPAQNGQYLHGRAYSNVVFPYRYLVSIFADKGIIEESSINIHEANEDPGIPMKEREDTTTEWRPTLKVIDDKGYKSYIEFIYTPPDYEEDFTNETIDLPQEDVVSCMYGDAIVSANIALTEPEDWKNIALAAYVLKDHTVRLPGGNRGRSFVPVYLASTHPKEFWGGIRGIVCKEPEGSSNDGGATSIHGGVREEQVIEQPPEVTRSLVEISRLPSSISSESIRQVSGSYWNRKVSRLLCGNEENEPVRYRYFYRYNCPIPVYDDGKNYPAIANVNFHHIKGNESAASTSVRVTSQLPSLGMSIIVDPEPVEVIEYYVVGEDYNVLNRNRVTSTTIMYLHRRITKHVYVQFDKVVSEPEVKLCIGDWDCDVTVRHTHGSVSTGIRSNLPTRLTSNDSHFNPGVENGRIICSGDTEEGFEAKSTYRYSITYGGGRDYLLSFAVIVKGVPVAFGSNTFKDSIDTLGRDYGWIPI